MTDYPLHKTDDTAGRPDRTAIVYAQPVAAIGTAQDGSRQIGVTKPGADRGRG